MHAGDQIVTSAEDLLQRTKVHLLASRRVRLTVDEWRYRICSPFWRIYVNDRKGAYLKFAGRHFELQPDLCYIVPAWVAFETGLRRPMDQAFIHFTWTGFSSAMLRAIFPEPVLLGRDVCLDPLIRRWLERFDESQSFDLVGVASTYALIYAALAQLLSQLPPKKREACFGWLSRPADIQLALDSIEKRLADPPTVKELSAAFHSSSSHFIRVFRQRVGLTPSQYSLERRIALAAEWLADPSRSIDHIAEAAGFTDRFHFSKAFKARLGVPPAAYRKLHLLPDIG